MKAPMRNILLLLLLTLAPALLADSADLQFTSFNTTKNVLQASERFTVTMRWRNNGPDAATGVVVTVGSGSGAFVTTGSGTSGWPCEPTFGNEGFACRGTLAVGHEAEMVVTMLAPSRGGSWTLRANIAATTPDPQPGNNSAQSVLELVGRPATSQSDLKIVPASQSFDAAKGARITIPLVVRNDGEPAEDVMVSLAFEPQTLIPIGASGSGWTCFNATHSPWLVLCSRPELRVGIEAPILVDVPALPQHDAVYRFHARVVAEGIHDAVPGNELATATVRVGSPVTYSRLLIPLIPNQTPGANNALWKAETMLLIRSDTQIGLSPELCDFIQVCSPVIQHWPLRKPFELQAMFSDDRGGMFLYTRTDDMPKLDANSRVYDLARLEETAGSEIPIPRESDFVATTISLLGIPVAPQYRHTLRVYDFDGSAGARVVVRVYANGEETPRANTIQTLTLSPRARRFTEHQLPTHPAYLQIDPAQLLSLADVTSLRVDVEPLDGSKIWAFVSLTNNDTHHVTTFSAQ